MPAFKTTLRWIFGAAAFGIFIFASQLNRFSIDWAWFEELGYLPVLKTILGWQVAIGLATFLLFAIVLYAQNYVIRRSRQQQQVTVLDDLLEVRDAALDPLIRTFVLVGIFIVSLFAAIGVAASWMIPLQARNATAFGTADPVFNRDIGFYIFQLPLNQWLIQIGFSLLFFSVLLLAGLSYYYGLISLGPKKVSVAPSVQIHAALLAASFFFLTGANTWLSRYGLLWANHNLITGANYSDIHARLPALGILTFLAFIAGLALLSMPILRRWALAATFVAIWFVFSFIGIGMMPEVLQRFTVSPNELKKETPYMERHLEATRKAFGLDQVKETVFPVSSGITEADIKNNPGTIDNIRLWDHRPLKESYKQLQEIRTYYDFVDVDIDRYTIDGRLRQVMLAAREISSSRLPSRNWINEHLVFTHGYGLVMNPVNRIGAGGMPEFFIKDIPPAAPAGLKIERPEIYFGEIAQDYVFVNTAQEEFDYPAGDNNVMTTYQGTGGLPVNSFVRKLSLAWELGNATILLSQDLTAQTRVMLHRQIQDRIRKIAPFLTYDSDPYIVLADGRLFWMIDGYTATDRYPYSKELPGVGSYIRNSVKVVVDAYNGTVDYYVSDAADPLMGTYRKIFPGLFKPLSDMPASLRAHVRYPEQLFRIQAHIYRTFHMDRAEVFYNKEDLWSIAREKYEDSIQDVQPYYTIMRLPDQPKEEFVLMLPFTPSKKDNLIAWFAARNDGDGYGQFLVYKFPKQQLVYGPLQIEARIDQEAEISKQLSLWGQRGSRVIRGNLLVIPIGKSLLYVEPLYLQAESGKLPELKRVIVASGNRLAMETDFPQALSAIFRGGVSIASSDAGDSGAGESGSNQGNEAYRIFREAQQALKNGDFATYGKLMERLESLLRSLAR